MNKQKIIIIVVLILVAGLSVVVSKQLSAKKAQREFNANVSIPLAVTGRGTFVCLPHKDTTGPQTLECASGFLTEANEYYAVSTEELPEEFRNLTQTDQRVEITGLTVPVEALSTDMWQKYNMKGIIQIKTIKKI
jgi:hypothetical protein